MPSKMNQSWNPDSRLRTLGILIDVLKSVKRTRTQ